MKKFYLFLIIIVAAILVTTVLIIRMINAPNKKVADLNADFAISTTRLASEVLADKGAAVVKYNGKVISLEGIVDEKEGDNLIFDEEGLSIKCQLPATEALKVRPKEQIKIKARFVGVTEDDILGTEVQLNNGVLEK